MEKSNVNTPSPPQSPSPQEETVQTPQSQSPPPPPPPPQEETAQTTPEGEINSEKIENLVRAAKELCEDNTITLQEKRTNAAKIIGTILVGSLKLLINTGRFIINGISFYLEKIPMVGGAIVIAIHSFIYLSILSLILLIINPIIPGNEITIKGVVSNISYAIFYLIQSMFIILWKNLAPDNLNTEIIRMKDEMYHRVLYFSNEIISNLGVIQGLNTSISTLQTSTINLLNSIQGLTHGTGEIARNVGKTTVYAAKYAGQNLGTGIKYGRGAMNYGTGAAAAFAGNLYNAAMVGFNQHGGGNTDVVSTELTIMQNVFNNFNSGKELGDLKDLASNMIVLFNSNGKNNTLKQTCDATIKKIAANLDELENSIDEEKIIERVLVEVNKLSSSEIDKLIGETSIILNILFSLNNFVVDVDEIIKGKIQNMSGGGKSKKNINMRLKKKKSITLKRRK